MIEELLKAHSHVPLQDLIDVAMHLISPERLDKFKNVLKRRTRHLVIVLEDIYQGHNASAILRTCEGYGIQYVYAIEKKNSFRPNEEIALGAHKWVKIYHYQDVQTVYNHLRKKGFTILATAFTSEAISIRDYIFRSPTAVVLGTEKDGLSEEAICCSDIQAYIPMEGFTSSFNVSVATGIILEVLTQKMNPDLFPRGLPEDEEKLLLLEWILLSFSNPQNIFETIIKKVQT